MSGREAWEDEREGLASTSELGISKEGGRASGGEKHIPQEDTGLLINQECTFDREVQAPESDESDKEGWTTGSFTIPKCGPALQNFQRQLFSLNIDYGIENLQAASLDTLTKYPFLTYRGVSLWIEEPRKNSAPIWTAEGS